MPCNRGVSHARGKRELYDNGLRLSSLSATRCNAMRIVYTSETRHVSTLTQRAHTPHPAHRGGAGGGHGDDAGDGARRPGGLHAHGKAVQVDSIRTRCLKLGYHKLLSTFAIICILRRYSMVRLLFHYEYLESRDRLKVWPGG